MNQSTVGASILNIITESLYDKPIVVFREYVQNSVDSLSSIETESEISLTSKIWETNNNLYFLDNGSGISQNDFINRMKSIAFSTKIKTSNLGYKGIGRLSGISYCDKLRFVNILSFKDRKFQEYSIDCIKYNSLQRTDNYNSLTFNELMGKIGTEKEDVSAESIMSDIGENQTIFTQRDTGFFVILEGISAILSNAIKEKSFLDDLSWLLPVPFHNELLEDDEVSPLFKWLSNQPAFEGMSTVAAKSYNIFYNNKQLYRPLKKDMFRTYLCKSNLDKYAVCIQSFSNEKIELDKRNAFSGIRIYIDNMLLCDENELIPALQQYGFTSHGLYELIQSVRGMGVIIYIVDKVNISANARRTFIEMTDQDAISFLELSSVMVDNIYDTRYALSKYASALKSEEQASEIVEAKRQKALKQLEILANDEITVEIKEITPAPVGFEFLPKSEQKRQVKSKIAKEINDCIKDYLNQTDVFNIDTCFEDFKTWFVAN